jgi:hypothetical protein
MHRSLAVLIAAGAASTALLLALGGDVAFMFEDWELLLHRRDLTAAAFLDPINEHLLLLPIAIYKAVQALFGIDSELPFHVASISLLLLCAGLLFLYLRRCVGDWPATLATTVVLFLGSAWEILLWPLTLSFPGSAAAGIGMLLALQREDRRGDMAACVLLAISIAFMSLGVLFAAAAATAIVLRGEHRLARSYVVAVPMLLYGLWYLGWGRDVESALSLGNLLAAPFFMLEGIASSIGALLGLFALQPYVSNLARLAGAAAVALTAAAAILWLARNGKLKLGWRDRPPWFWAAAVLFFGFWLITAANDVPFRTPSSSRYMHTGVVLLLLLLAESFRGVRLGPRATVAISAVAAVALAGNLIALRDGYRVFEREGQLIRAQLGALEIARDQVQPSFRPADAAFGSSALVNLDAGPYLSAAGAYGSPADRPAELAARPEYARAATDVVLAQALRLRLEPLPARAGAGAECARLGAGPEGAPAAAPLRPGSVVLRAADGRPVSVRLRRFAAETFPVVLGVVERGESARLRLPRDAAGRPWQLELPAAREILVCNG